MTSYLWITLEPEKAKKALRAAFDRNTRMLKGMISPIEDFEVSDYICLPCLVSALYRTQHATGAVDARALENCDCGRSAPYYDDLVSRAGYGEFLASAAP